MISTECVGMGIFRIWVDGGEVAMVVPAGVFSLMVSEESSMPVGGLRTLVT